MSMNNQSRSLIEISKMQGWDPTKVDGIDLSRFNVPSAVDNHVEAGKYGVGELPGGNPDGWPDGYDSEHPQASISPGQTDFATPDAGRETANRATKNATPWNGGRIG
jgi:hypothetical protein